MNDREGRMKLNEDAISHGMTEMLLTKVLNGMVGTSDQLNQPHTTSKLKNRNRSGREI